MLEFFFEGEPASPEERARACTHCANIRARHHPKRKRWRDRELLEQHRAHVASNVYHQLYALARGEGWILSLDEAREVQEWEPDVRPLTTAPF